MCVTNLENAAFYAKIGANWANPRHRGVPLLPYIAPTGDSQ